MARDDPAPTAPPPDVARLLRERFPPLRPQLVKAAVRLSGSDDRAGEFVHRAYEKLLSGRRRWDPVAKPDLFGVAYLAVKSEIHHWWRQQRGAFPDVSLDEPRDDEEPPVAAFAGPDARVLDDEKQGALEAVVADLRGALAGDPLAARLLDLVLDGVKDGDEQAARLGASLRDVDNARRRLRYAATDGMRKRTRQALLPRARVHAPPPLPAPLAGALAFTDSEADALFTELSSQSADDAVRDLAAEGVDVGTQLRYAEGKGWRDPRDTPARRALAFAFLAGALAFLVFVLGRIGGCF